MIPEHSPHIYPNLNRSLNENGYCRFSVAVVNRLSVSEQSPPVGASRNGYSDTSSVCLHHHA